MTRQDLKDLDQAIKSLDRIAKRHGAAWHDDFKFDPLAAALARLKEVRQQR